MMIDLKDKRIKIAIMLITIVGFTTYYFYPKDEYIMEIEKHTNLNVEKIENTFKKKDITVSNREIKENKVEEEQIIKKGNVLFTESDPSGRYTVQLLNDIDINLKTKDNSRNITIFCEIEDNSVKTDFSLSIGEEYINYLSDLKIKIVDSTNNERILETASYFLGALDLDSSYKIKLNISGNTLDGKVINSEKLSKEILQEIEKGEENTVNKEEN